MTPAVMITDDHKSNKVRKRATANADDREDLDTTPAEEEPSPAPAPQPKMQMQAPPQTRIRVPAGTVAQMPVLPAAIPQETVAPRSSKRANVAEIDTALGSAEPAEPVKVKRCIPAHGPVQGGVEVTILGTGFKRASSFTLSSFFFFLCGLCSFPRSLSAC
jgi:hypothetical protein